MTLERSHLETSKFTTSRIFLSNYTIHPLHVSGTNAPINATLLHPTWDDPGTDSCDSFISIAVMGSEFFTCITCRGREFIIFSNTYIFITLKRQVHILMEWGQIWLYSLFWNCTFFIQLEVEILMFSFNYIWLLFLFHFVCVSITLSIYF